MRKQLRSAILTGLLLGTVAFAAETPATPRNELQRVNVVRGGDQIQVEISARGTVTPKLSTESSPARLVVDLPGTVMATGQRLIAVDSEGVKQVRIGMDGRVPPTTRVVIDLDHPCRYELNPAANGKLVLTLHTQQTAASATPAKSASANASANAGKNMSPFAPRVAEVAKEKAVAPKPTPALAAITVPASATPASTDFVFVEPTYSAKGATPETTSAVTTPEPAVRAQEAAAKFSDKTAAELLPVSVHADQTSATPASNTGS